jgi:hypothetical protein
VLVSNSLEEISMSQGPFNPKSINIGGPFQPSHSYQRYISPASGRGSYFWELAGKAIEAVAKQRLEGENIDQWANGLAKDMCEIGEQSVVMGVRDDGDE